MRKETRKWLDMASYDIETAKHMINTGRYIYVIFMCHLAIEKTLKALIWEVTGKYPPKSHDLIYLAKKASVNFPEREMLNVIGKINNASIVTRYPDDLSRAVTAYPKEVVQEYLQRS